MRYAVALLAAALLVAGAPGCGGDGAEPGAPDGATLVLDFMPNAAHSGIYAAERRGHYEDAGIRLQIREPGQSTDAPKLLEAGRAEFAILDIQDLGIARERGLDVVGLAPIVNRPLASIIARADGGVRRPRDLMARTVGVTGLPSDDAVVDSAVAADGGDPGRVNRVTIGFNAVASLAAGRVDAATGFRNAEAVALRRRGIPIRVLPVERYGAPPFPELVLVASRATIERDPELVDAVLTATRRGYALAARRPGRALDDLLTAVPALDRADQAAQLRVLLPAIRPTPFDAAVLREWAAWARRHAILERHPKVGETFLLPRGRD